MPIRLNVGISKKLGLPRYSSVGASCAVEVELSSALLDQGSDAFHDRVSRIYRVCREAVEEELARQQAIVPHASDEVLCQARNDGARLQDRFQNERRSLVEGEPDGGHSIRSVGGADKPGDGNGHGNGQGQVPLPATAQQMEYAHDLAAQIDGLTEEDLETLSQQVCGKALAELSRREASMFIGTLLEILDGEIALDILLGRGGAEAQPS